VTGLPRTKRLTYKDHHGSGKGKNWSEKKMTKLSSLYAEKTAFALGRGGKETGKNPDPCWLKEKIALRGITP